MARGRSSRSRRTNTQQTVTQPIVTQVTRGRSSTRSTSRDNAYPDYRNACIGVISVMKRYAMPGIEKMANNFAETAHGLVSPQSFLSAATASPTGTSTNRRSSSRRTSSRRTATAGGAIKLTAPQQQVFNSINPNEQLNPAQVSARTGMALQPVSRALNALQRKKLLTRTGRGQSATFWKAAQAIAA